MSEALPEASDLATTEEAKGTPIDHKTAENHVEYATPTSSLNYDDDEREPELHARTYVALFAMFLLNMVQVLALQGPPAVVRDGCDYV